MVSLGVYGLAWLCHKASKKYLLDFNNGKILVGIEAMALNVKET